jgi:nitrile hydratase accessory protein
MPDKRATKQMLLTTDAGQEASFPNPWSAHAFAITLQLHEQNCFSWTEWTDRLAAEVSLSARDGDGRDYYTCWTDALCQLLQSKGLIDEHCLNDLQLRWQRAALATTHGDIVRLENDLTP